MVKCTKSACSQKPFFGNTSLGFPYGEIWAGEIELSGDFASHGVRGSDRDGTSTPHQHAGAAKILGLDELCSINA